MELSDLRKKLDEIDEQIVQLYEQRMQVCAGVAEYKIETGKQVLDTAREAEKIVKVKEMVKNPENKQGVEELFEQIMSMSRKLQYKMLAEGNGKVRLPFDMVEELPTDHTRIVFQGSEGSYSQAACLAFFGKTADSFHVESFRDTMNALEEGRADYAVLPIENSTAGIVNEIYDLLVEYENYIVGEQIIKIEHCLMACPGTKKEDIKTVYSHPQSLMQCARYLQQYDWQQISMKNNAFAAEKVAKDKEKTEAAIAGEHAAEAYGLSILEKGINQSESNSTRFVILSNRKIYRKDAGKVSICFELPHKSGSLYHALSHIIFNNLNMTKIESRPIEDRNWEYRFYVDFEGNLTDSAVMNALRGLREETRSMKILGNY
ncbi:MAG: prephenate dehydratase [Lachnospiraceae bacterium]